MNLFVLPKHLGLPRDEHVVSDVTEMHDARVRDVHRKLLGVAANHDATPRHELIDRRAFRSVFGLVSRVGQQDVGRRGEIQQRENRHTNVRIVATKHLTLSHRAAHPLGRPGRADTAVDVLEHVAEFRDRQPEPQPARQ